MKTKTLIFLFVAFALQFSTALCVPHAPQPFVEMPRFEPAIIADMPAITVPTVEPITDFVVLPVVDCTPVLVPPFFDETALCVADLSCTYQNATLPAFLDDLRWDIANISCTYQNATLPAFFDDIRLCETTHLAYYQKAAIFIDVPIEDTKRGRDHIAKSRLFFA